MSFDATEKYNTRLLIPKETIMFATVAVLSNGAKRTTPKSMCTRKARWPVVYCFKAVSQAPFSFVKYVCDFVHVVSFLACVAGVRNFKNLLLINQKIYVHDGWVFVCYQYRGILYCNALPAFSLRDASCNVIDIEITCRTFGSVIVALFPICTFARGKGSLETMIYLTVSDCRHGFRSTLKLS